MALLKESDSGQNCGDFRGDIPPNSFVGDKYSLGFDPYENMGDYLGEVPPNLKDMPGVRGLGHLGKETEDLLGDPNRLQDLHPKVHEIIYGLQSSGKKVIAKVDAHKGTTLIAGTAVAIGAVAGGIVIKEYSRRKHK